MSFLESFRSKKKTTKRPVVNKSAKPAPNSRKTSPAEVAIKNMTGPISRPISSARTPKPNNTTAAAKAPNSLLPIGNNHIYKDQVEIVIQFKNRVSCPIILVSSPEPSLGSPRAVVNLAIALIKTAGFNVLLVEADLQRHDLTSVFGLPATKGFYEWRRGEIWASQVVSSTDLARLSFMQAGSPSAEQCEPKLDLSKEWHRWSNLRRNYEAILLYCPGALTADPKSPEKLASVALLDLAEGMFVQTRSANVAQISATTTTKARPPSVKINEVLQGRRVKFLGYLPMITQSSS